MTSNGDDNGQNHESGTGKQPENLHEGSLSLDTVLSLLAHHQRRALLRSLVETPGQTCNINKCIANMVEREEERTGDRPRQDEVEAALHHTHIPKLANTGILEYDSRNQDIRYWRNDRLETWLDLIQSNESSRPASDHTMTEHPENEIIHRELDTDADNPAVQVANVVAEIEETDTTDLATMYDCVDGVLDHLFSNPPVPEAQMQVEFSYEGYRITTEQNGTTKLVKTEQSQ